MGARAAPGPARPPVEPVRLSELDERAVYRVLDFCLRAGEILLSGGAGVADVTATIQAAGRAFGLEHLEVDITFTSITAAYLRGPDVFPVTSLRIVRYRTLDYSVVTDVDNVVVDLVMGRIGEEEAFRRLAEVRQKKHLYPRLLINAASATVSASFALLLGGGWLVALVTFSSTLVVTRVLAALGRRNLPVFYANAVGATIATAAALALAASGVEVRSSLVVAGGIIVLLPGVTLVGAVQDAITGYYVTAAGRAFEVLLLVAGIISGVAATLYVGVRFGIVISVRSPAGNALDELAVQVLGSAIAAAAFALSSSAPRRTLPACGVIGALGFASYRGMQLADVPPTFATAVAALFVGLAAYLAAQRQRAPQLLYVVSGIVPLLPGLTIYQGMLQLSGGSTVPGIVTLGQAAAIGLALAAGAILGEFLAQPGQKGVRRYQRPLAGPRLAGPPVVLPEETEDPAVLAPAEGGATAPPGAEAAGGDEESVGLAILGEAAPEPPAVPEGAAEVPAEVWPEPAPARQPEPPPQPQPQPQRRPQPQPEGEGHEDDRSDDGEDDPDSDGDENLEEDVPRRTRQDDAAAVRRRRAGG